MNPRTRFTQIDEYIASMPPEKQKLLEEIRRIVKDVIPGATETISYNLPAFKQGKVFFYFAAFQHHIGIYPPVHGDPQLEEELQRYRNERGNLQFPLSEPLPYELITRVALALAQEYSTK